MHRFRIDNPQVKEIYDRVYNGFAYTGHPEEIRLQKFYSLEIIQAIVAIYEREETLPKEEIDDLFLIRRPVFPEEMPEISKRINETLKRLKQQEE